jgi:hypothetical protein
MIPSSTSSTSTSITTHLLSSWFYVKRYINSIGESPQQAATAAENENDNGTSSSIVGSDNDHVVEAVHPTLMDVTAIVGVGGSLVTLALTEGHIVDAASYLTMGIAPYCAYQKRNLTELGGLRGQHNQLRQNVNELQTENHTLTKSIDQLESNVNQ